MFNTVVIILCVGAAFAGLYNIFGGYRPAEGFCMIGIAAVVTVFTLSGKTEDLYVDATEGNELVEEVVLPPERDTVFVTDTVRDTVYLYTEEIDAEYEEIEEIETDSIPFEPVVEETAAEEPVQDTVVVELVSDVPLDTDEAGAVMDTALRLADELLTDMAGGN